MQVAKGWIPKNIVREIRELDLLTYLERYEPFELVRISPNVHSTRTHDSLKISHGKWFWWSRNIGGTSALDYLVHARGMDFYSAARHICGLMGRDASKNTRGNTQNSLMKPSRRATSERVPFCLPRPNGDNDRVIDYLARRCVHSDVILSCIERHLLYEDAEYHNAVFVGFDEDNNAHYAYKRATWDNKEPGKRSYMGDVSGSKKQYAFALTASDRSDRLIVTEAPIDALSVASLMHMRGEDWQSAHILALCGVAKPMNRDGIGANAVPPAPLPVALEHYLDKHREIVRVTFCLDNDEVGRGATDAIMSRMARMATKYAIDNKPPPSGKDYNDYLQMKCRSKNRAALSR